MDPVELHVATGRLRRQPSIPREVLVQLVQADLRCSGDEAIAVIDRLVTDGYLVDALATGVRVIRRGPRERHVVPSHPDASVDP